MIFTASMFFLGGIVKNSINVLVQMKKIKCRRLRLQFLPVWPEKKKKKVYKRWVGGRAWLVFIFTFKCVFALLWKERPSTCFRIIIWCEQWNNSSCRLIGVIHFYSPTRVLEQWLQFLSIWICINNEYESKAQYYRFVYWFMNVTNNFDDTVASSSQLFCMPIILLWWAEAYSIWLMEEGTWSPVNQAEVRQVNWKRQRQVKVLEPVVGSTFSTWAFSGDIKVPCHPNLYFHCFLHYKGRIRNEFDI